MGRQSCAGLSRAGAVLRLEVPMAKILLAHPLFLSSNKAETAAASPYFPLGLLYLAAYVREAGHDVAVFDGTFADDVSAFAEALQAETPDLVGISAVMPTRSDALLLARMASDYGAVVILGGPDPTMSPEAYLASPSVDVVVHHEGEQTVVALVELFAAGELDTTALESEPGVAFRKDGQPRINEPRRPIENLDELPLPARDLIDMDRYLDVWEDESGYSSMTIATSRGCPYGCEWCRDAVHGNGFRQRSPESVAEEMKTIKDTWDVTRLRMVDDVDAIDRGWLEAWAEASEAIGAAIPFEGLNELSRQDIPLLEVRDSL